MHQANHFGFSIGGDKYIDVVTHPEKGGVTQYAVRCYTKTFNREEVISKVTYDRESDLHAALEAFGVEANETLSHMKFVGKKTPAASTAAPAGSPPARRKSGTKKRR